MLKRSLLLFSLIGMMCLSIVSSVYADETTDALNDLQKKIDEYSKKVTDLKSRANTLQNEVEYMDSQINLTELRIQESQDKISQKENQIKKLTVEIDDLKVRISKLADSIEYQRMLLNSRLRERYKSRETNPILIVFGSSTLNSLVQKVE